MKESLSPWGVVCLIADSIATIRDKVVYSLELSSESEKRIEEHYLEIKRELALTKSDLISEISKLKENLKQSTVSGPIILDQKVADRLTKLGVSFDRD